MSYEANDPGRALCRFCGFLRPREQVCCGPTEDIVICLDCAELAVDIITAAQPSTPR